MLSGIQNRVQPLAGRKPSCLDTCNVAVSKLCDVCEKMVEASKLLNRLSYLLPISKTEHHEHCQPMALAQSKANCRLCALLHSTITTSEHTWVSSTSQPLTIAVSRPSHSSKSRYVIPPLLTLRIAEIPGPIALTVRRGEYGEVAHIHFEFLSETVANLYERAS